MSDTFWRVLIEYPMDGNQGAIEKAIRHATGREFAFSGGGMGMRDVGWHCDLEIDARRLAKLVKAIGLTPVVKELSR